MFEFGVAFFQSLIKAVIYLCVIVAAVISGKKFKEYKKNKNKDIK